MWNCLFRPNWLNINIAQWLKYWAWNPPEAFDHIHVHAYWIKIFKFIFSSKLLIFSPICIWHTLLINHAIFQNQVVFCWFENYFKEKWVILKRLYVKLFAGLINYRITVLKSEQYLGLVKNMRKNWQISSSRLIFTLTKISLELQNSYYVSYIFTVKKPAVMFMLWKMVSSVR